jgi:hypothetical protein
MADLTVAAETCVALGATERQFESHPGRDIALGALTVTRVLPVKGKRLVGYESLLRPAGVNVMTSGAAIAHAIAASKGSRCRSECCTTLGPIVPRCVSAAGLGADYY